MSEVSNTPCTIRCKKLIVNQLLHRKQFVVEIVNRKPGNVSKAQVNALLAKMFKVTNPKTIFTFGFKTAFGGGRSTGFGLIYDTEKDAMRYEPKYRLVREGMAQKVQVGRKALKEKKGKAKKQWGCRTHVKKE